MADIVDAPERHRFEYEEGGEFAELVYRDEVDRLVLVHTGVPEALGGRGLAGELVQAALERARADGLTLVPECSYARKWLREHPADVGDVRIEWPAGNEDG